MLLCPSRFADEATRGPLLLAPVTKIPHNTHFICVFFRHNAFICRTGDSTTHFEGYGDGASDVFVATLSGANNYRVVTSSAVQTVAVSNGTLSG